MPDEGRRSDEAFSLLDPGIQRQLCRMNWTELRDLQVRAIHAVLETDRPLVLTAPTAAGKTEAAFLPIFSRIAAEPGGSVRASYAGPLKALISGAVATAFCSRTLEMGIDIGSVRAVGQVGTPFSVASLKQRLGRSGRRPGESRTIRLYIECEKPREDADAFDRLHLNLVQTVAMMELMVADKWVEPPRTASCDLSTLAQQVMSAVAEKGAAGAEEIYGRLCRRGALREVEPRVFAALLRSLAAADVLEQCSGGELILGLKGEAIRKDKGFYAVFATPEDFPVLDGGRVVGRIGYLPAEHQKGECFLLARKRWRIVGVDLERKEIHVVRARGRKPPVFARSNGGEVHPRVREKIREVLADGRNPAYLDSRAAEMLAYARNAYRNAGFHGARIVALGERRTAVLTWTGSRINRTLISWLSWLGHPVEDAGIGFVSDSSSASVSELLRHADASNPDAELLARHLDNPPLRKYDHLLTEELRFRALARDSIDLEGARTVLRTICMSN